MKKEIFKAWGLLLISLVFLSLGISLLDSSILLKILGGIISLNSIIFTVIACKLLKRLTERNPVALGLTFLIGFLLAVVGIFFLVFLRVSQSDYLVVCLFLSLFSMLMVVMLLMANRYIQIQGEK